MSFYSVSSNGNILQNYTDINIDTVRMQNISISPRTTHVSRSWPHPLASCSYPYSLGKHESALHFSNFVALGMLCKWIVLHNLWGLTSFWQHSSLKMYTRCSQSVPFYCRAVRNSWCGLSSHAPVEGRLSCFQFCLLETKPMDTLYTDFCVKISFVSLEWMSKSAIAGPYGSCIFSLWRHCQIVSHSGCPILHPL